MKYIKLLLAGFACRVQACWAEFGEQECFTGQAVADLSACQYLAMRLTGAGPTVNIASHNLGASAAGMVAGILQNNPTSGQAATIARSGISKAKTGASVTVNALVTHDASGFIIDAVSGSNVIGRALETGGGAGQIVTVMLQQPVRWGSVA